jgi:hypothetical protein
MSLMQKLAYSKQSGVAVLGYGISSTDGTQSVCALLKKDDFSLQVHHELFSALQKMYEKGMPLDIYLDIFLLCEELKRQKRTMGLEEKLTQSQRVFSELKPAQGPIEKAKPFSFLGEMLSHDFPLPSNVVSCEAIPSGRACLSSYSIRYYIFFKGALLVGNCEECIGLKVLSGLLAFDASAHELTIG